ncbi:MBL fold metallo-hydrolase [Clostridium sp. MB40-C1]|uniref:MBL fold metallo-hydrolase n=1 Tax=Clostridium sp. MB40-C1 TaxID=3070996 RepID=UPI0027E17C30|nr:MBL fold metallo-hydrolase [Clostridium sp. MB40-C1]WMJ79276.1 MBL fold metallo-hydrolase [Clostridium sp. MB40-C1]
MKIITLIENTKNKNSSHELISEQGLCLYIEKGNKRILFDTGRRGNFINNAGKLGVDLEKVDVVVISHGHGDHGGGLLEFFKINSKAKVYMKRNAQKEYYFCYFNFNFNVSIDRKVFDEYSSRINYVDSFTEIMDGIFIITDIDKQYKVPRGNKYLYVKEGNKLVLDKFHHELIMIIKEAEGICIFAGCSHNGISNIIETSKNAFPHINIKAVIGGFHLVTLPIIKSLSASREEIDEIAKKIIEDKVEKIYTGHCTGEKAYKKLKNILGDKIEYIRTGSEVNI